jgi:geranylgeranyl diphosphate synthase, type I
VTSTPAPSAGWDAGWDAGSDRRALQASLEEFVEQQGRLLLPLGPDAARLVDAARGAVSGGKRLRALFCQAGFRAVREPSGP